jgi:hypothetical protein
MQSEGIVEFGGAREPRNGADKGIMPGYGRFCPAKERDWVRLFSEKDYDAKCRGFIHYQNY